MRFRIPHLLLAAVGIAIFAAAFAKPSDGWLSLVRTATWLTFATLAIRAGATSNRERSQVIGALILGLSYLLLSSWADWLPMSAWLYEAFIEDRVQGSQARYSFAQTGECCFAIVFALLGALLGNHFSKSQRSAE